MYVACSFWEVLLISYCFKRFFPQYIRDKILRTHVRQWLSYLWRKQNRNTPLCVGTGGVQVRHLLRSLHIAQSVLKETRVSNMTLK